MRADRWLQLILLSAGLSSPCAWGADWPLIFSGELTGGYDSNVGNAEDSADIHGSALIAGAVHGEQRHILSANTALLARGSLKGEWFSRFDGLGNLKLEGMLRLNARPWGGVLTPSFALTAAIAEWQFDSRLRDSHEYRLTAALLKPLTTALQLRLSLSAAERNADSAVFDLDHRSVGLDLDWRASPRFTLYGGYQYRDGEVVSSSTANPSLRDAAAARANDDAFAELSTPLIAYRLAARTHIGSLGVNYPLSPRLAVDVLTRFVDSRAEADLDYSRWIGLVSLLARF